MSRRGQTHRDANPARWNPACGPCPIGAKRLALLRFLCFSFEAIHSFDSLVANSALEIFADLDPSLARHGDVLIVFF